MGLIEIGQFFGKHISLAPTRAADNAQAPLSDVERIAQAIAVQNGAPATSWPLFVHQAETLIGWSERWMERC